MQKSFTGIKGLGFILWHAKHEIYHALLGIVWAWILREWWGELNWKWIALSVAGSLLPDVDHILYFFTYGREEAYTKNIFHLIKTRQWRNVTLFIKNGHKYNTGLSYHNYYVAGALLIISLLSILYDWQTGIILFGAMVIHYAFDILDDIFILGYTNSNWKRWGREREI